MYKECVWEALRNSSSTLTSRSFYHQKNVVKHENRKEIGSEPLKPQELEESFQETEGGPSGKCHVSACCAPLVSNSLNESEIDVKEIKCQSEKEISFEANEDRQLTIEKKQENDLLGISDGIAENDYSLPQKNVTKNCYDTYAMGRVSESSENSIGTTSYEKAMEIECSSYKNEKISLSEQKQDMTRGVNILKSEVSNTCHIEESAKAYGLMKSSNEKNKTLEPLSQSNRNFSEVRVVQKCFKKRPVFVTRIRKMLTRGVKNKYLTKKPKNTPSFTLAQDTGSETQVTSKKKGSSNESVFATDTSTEGMSDSKTFDIKDSSFIAVIKDDTDVENQVIESNDGSSSIFNGNKSPQTSAGKSWKLDNQFSMETESLSSKTSRYSTAVPSEGVNLHNFEPCTAEGLCSILRKANALKDGTLVPIPSESLTLEIMYAAVNCGMFTDEHIWKWVKRIRHTKIRDHSKAYQMQLKLLKALFEYLTKVDKRHRWKSILQSSRYCLPKCNEMCVLFETKDFMRDEVLNFYKSLIFGRDLSSSINPLANCVDDEFDMNSKCLKVQDSALEYDGCKQSISNAPCKPFQNATNSTDFVDINQEFGSDVEPEEKGTERISRDSKLELGISVRYSKQLDCEPSTTNMFEKKASSKTLCGCSCSPVIRELCDILNSVCNLNKYDSVTSRKKVVGKKVSTFKKDKYKCVAQVDKILTTLCEIITGKPLGAEFHQMLLDLYHDVKVLESSACHNKAELVKYKTKIKTKVVHIQELHKVAKIANKRLESCHRRIRSLEEELKCSKSAALKGNQQLKERIAYLESELEKPNIQRNPRETKNIGDKVNIALNIALDTHSSSNSFANENPDGASGAEIRSPLFSKVDPPPPKSARMTARTQITNRIEGESPVPMECKEISQGYQSSVCCIGHRTNAVSADACNTLFEQHPCVSSKIPENTLVGIPVLSNSQLSSTVTPVSGLMQAPAGLPLESPVPSVQLLSGVAPDPGVFLRTRMISQVSEIGHRPAVVPKVPSPSSMVRETCVFSSVSHGICVSSPVIAKPFWNPISAKESYKDFPAMCTVSRSTPIVSNTCMTTIDSHVRTIPDAAAEVVTPPSYIDTVSLQNEHHAVKKKDKESLLNCISQQNLLLTQNRNAAKLQELLLDQMCKDLLFYQSKAHEQRVKMKDCEDKVIELEEKLLHEEFRVCSLERRLKEIKEDKDTKKNQRIITVPKEGREFRCQGRAFSISKEQSEHLKELEERLVSCSNIISDKNRTIRTLEADITNHNNTIKSLEAVITSLMNQVKLLQEQMSAPAMEGKQLEIEQLKEKTEILQKDIEEKNISLRQLQQEASYFAHIVLAQQKAMRDSGLLENTSVPSVDGYDHIDFNRGKSDSLGSVVSRVTSSVDHNQELIMLLKQRKNEMPRLISILRELDIRLRERMSSNNVFRDYLDLEMLFADVTLLIFSCMETDEKLGRFLQFENFLESDEVGHECQFSGNKLNGKKNTDKDNETCSDFLKCKNSKKSEKSSVDFMDVKQKSHRQLKCRKIGDGNVEGTEILIDAQKNNHILDKFQDPCSYISLCNQSAAPIPFEAHAVCVTPERNSVCHGIVDCKRTHERPYAQEQCHEKDCLSFKSPDEEKAPEPKQLLIENDLCFELESVGLNLVQEKALTLRAEAKDTAEERVVHNVYASEEYAKLSLLHRNPGSGGQDCNTVDRLSVSSSQELACLPDDAKIHEEELYPECDSGKMSVEPSCSGGGAGKVNQVSCALVIKRLLQKGANRNKRTEEQSTYPQTSSQSDEKMKNSGGIFTTDGQEGKLVNVYNPEVMHEHSASSIVQSERSGVNDFLNQACNENTTLKKSNKKVLKDKDSFHRRQDCSSSLISSETTGKIEGNDDDIDPMNKIQRRKEGTSVSVSASRKREREEEQECVYGKKRRKFTCQSSFVSDTSELKFDSNFATSSTLYTGKCFSVFKQTNSMNCESFSRGLEKDVIFKNKKEQHTKRKGKKTLKECGMEFLGEDLSKKVSCETNYAKINEERGESNKSRGDSERKSNEGGHFEVRHVLGLNFINGESGSKKVFALAECSKEMKVKVSKSGECSVFDNESVYAKNLLRNAVVAQLWRRYQSLEKDNESFKERVQSIEEDCHKKVVLIQERDLALVKALKERDEAMGCKEKTVRLLKDLEAENRKIMEKLRSKEEQEHFNEEKTLIEATSKSRIAEKEKCIEDLNSQLKVKMDVITDQGNYIVELLREKAEFEKARREVKLKSKQVKEKYIEKLIFEHADASKILDIKTLGSINVKAVSDKVKNFTIEISKYIGNLKNMKAAFESLLPKPDYSTYEVNFEQMVTDSLSIENGIKILMNEIANLIEALTKQKPKEMNSQNAEEPKLSIACGIIPETTKCSSLNLQQKKTYNTSALMKLKEITEPEYVDKEAHEFPTEKKLCKAVDVHSCSDNILFFKEQNEKIAEYESILKEKENTLQELQNKVEGLISVKNEFSNFEKLLEQTLGILSVPQEKECINLQECQKSLSHVTEVTLRYSRTQEVDVLKDKTETLPIVKEATSLKVQQSDCAGAKRERILKLLMSLCRENKELEGIVNKMHVEKSELSKVVESLSFKIKDVQSSCGELETEKQLLVESKKHIDEENRKLRHSLESWITEKRQLQELIESLNSENRELCKKLMEKEAEIKMKNDQVTKIEDILRGKREKVNELLLHNQNLLKDVNQKDQLISHYTNVLEESKRSKKESEGVILELKKNALENMQNVITVKEENQNLKNLHEIICKEKQTLAATISTLRNENDVIKGKVLNLETELKFERNEHCKTLGSLGLARQEINDKVAENEKLVRSIRKVQANDEKAGLNLKIKGKLQQSKGLVSEIESLKCERNELRKLLAAQKFQYQQLEKVKESLSFKLKEEGIRFKSLLKQRNEDWRKEYSILVTQFNEIADYNTKLIDQVNHWNEFRIMLCRALNIKLSYELSNSPSSQDIEYISQLCYEQKHLENKMKTLKSSLWEEQLRNEKLGRLLHEEQSKVHAAEMKIQELEVEVMTVKESFEREQMNNVAQNMKLRDLEENKTDHSPVEIGQTSVYEPIRKPELQMLALPSSTHSQEVEAKLEIAEAFAREEQIKSNHLMHVMVDVQRSNESLKETLREERSQYLTLLTEVNRGEQKLGYQTKNVCVRVTDKECQTHDSLDKVYEDEIAKVQYSFDLEQMSSHYFCKIFIGECRDFKENLELWLRYLNSYIDKQMKRREQFEEIISAVTEENIFE
ncbi:golgin subfamily B member 1-like [Macrobrachium rosenbergii]|uniref:golgin subfamily B member 1-like n=1 Tax=Macrobrachium rosenbergii TaxID=79674 RepID=UPI0034D76D81